MLKWWGHRRVFSSSTTNNDDDDDDANIACISLTSINSPGAGYNTSNGVSPEAIAIAEDDDDDCSRKGMLTKSTTSTRSDSESSPLMTLATKADKSISTKGISPTDEQHPRSEGLGGFFSALFRIRNHNAKEAGISLVQNNHQPYLELEATQDDSDVDITESCSDIAADSEHPKCNNGEELEYLLRDREKMVNNDEDLIILWKRRRQRENVRRIQQSIQSVLVGGDAILHTDNHHGDLTLTQAMKIESSNNTNEDSKSSIIEQEEHMIPMDVMLSKEKELEDYLYDLWVQNMNLLADDMMLYYDDEPEYGYDNLGWYQQLLECDDGKEDDP